MVAQVGAKAKTVDTKNATLKVRMPAHWLVSLKLISAHEGYPSLSAYVRKALLLLVREAEERERRMRNGQNG